MKRRLALVGYSLLPGGIERVMANLANHWAARGHEVTVVTLQTEASDFYELDGRVSRVALGLAEDSASALDAIRGNYRRVRSLRRVLLDFRPDVVIGFATSSNVLVALASLRAPWVTVGSEHIHPPRFEIGRSWAFLRRRFYGSLDTVTALTPEMRDWILGNTSASRVKVIPNPVWPLPAVESTSDDPWTVVPRDRKLLLAVGRLTYQKGFDLLLDAFAELAPRHPDWDLVVLGEGEDRHALESRTRQHGLPARVKLPGVTSNVGAWYRRADLYVMSSRFEGFGNTLAEALCSGTPAVSFDCQTGPATIIRHSVDGLLVPPEDIEGLIEALDLLMEDEALRKRYATAAIEARNRYSISDISLEWEALFEELAPPRP